MPKIPYVRKHGNQVAIVHGERDATGAVQQRVLFSLYSQPEAEAAIGLRTSDPPLSLAGLLESHHEGLRFNWPKINAAIAALKDELPDRYAYPTAGVAPLLRSGIVGMLKALLVANPQDTYPASEALKQNRRELLLLRQIIDDRLMLVDQASPHEFNRDNEYGWRGRLAGSMPTEAWERLDGLQSRGESEQAEVFAGMLVEAWPDFADGYNTLGWAALDREEYDAALAWFARAMEVGRTLFPKRIPRSNWWSNHETRPYIRAMRNTALALAWAWRDEQVLPWCDRLEQECQDSDVAAVHRATACLNLGRWRESLDAASRVAEIWPEQDLVAAWAAFQLGERDLALARWLHAAIQRPRAARMVLGIRMILKPRGYEQTEDHNSGVYLVRSLGASMKRKPARRFFTAIMSSPEMDALIDEHEAAVTVWRENRSEDRTGYRRMMEMQTSAFAHAQARRLSHLITEIRP